MTIEQLINKATTFKKLAQSARKSGNYSQAIKLIERAVDTLEPEKSRLESVEKGAVSAENRALAEALAEVYGSSGGIYRSAQEYEKSVAAYDKGNVIEQDPRFGFINSYNLTQRLVARVLLEPGQCFQPGRMIAGKDFTKTLHAAIDIVRSQTIGPRAGDVWAWADLGMLSLLNGDTTTAENAWQMLVTLARQPFVFDSTLSVVADLLERIEPVSAEGGADPRLISTADSLRQAQNTLKSSMRNTLTTSMT